jgi:hypothetical protein
MEAKPASVPNVLANTMLQIGEQYAQKETQQFKFCISPDHLTL